MIPKHKGINFGCPSYAFNVSTSELFVRGSDLLNIPSVFALSFHIYYFCPAVSAGAFPFSDSEHIQFHLCHLDLDNQ